MTTTLTNALSAGSIIGHLTWYDCRGAHITPADLKKLFDKHNLDHKYFPDNIKPKHAFQKACRQAMVKDSNNSDDRPAVVKLIVDGMNKIVYGVVDLDVNEGTESIEPDFSDRVWLDKDNFTVGYDKGHRASKRIEQIFNRLCGEYMTRDIARMVVRSVNRMCSVSLRDAGVIYFIPVAFEKEMKALQAVVNDIGQCNMRLFAIGDGNGNVPNIEQTAKSQITDKVKAMKADLSELKGSIDNSTIKGKTVSRSVDVRLKRFRELKDKCKILADSLKIKAEVLEGELDDVAKVIKADLLEYADGDATL